MTLPPGYRTLDVGGARAFAVPEAEAWVEAQLMAHGSLYEAARRAEDVMLLQGRAPVYAVPLPGGGRGVVRRYHRGGAVARLLGDRHLRLGTPRPWEEALASEEARRRGLPTPRVLAGAVHPRGFVYRADVVTEYVPHSEDLAARLFAAAGSRPPVGDRTRPLRLAGELVAAMARAGLRHPDLNAKNVLFTTASDAALLVDLDRCRVTDGGPVDPGRMLARLERSLGKLGERDGPPLTTPEWHALRAAARPAPSSDAGTP